MKKTKIISGLCIILPTIYICILVFIKVGYYIERYQAEWFSGIFQAILWSIGSILISALPLLLLFADGVAQILSDRSPLHVLMILLTWYAWAVNIVVEVMSAMGAGMSLDSVWMDMAISMTVYHLLSLLPLSIGVISIVVRKK